MGNIHVKENTPNLNSASQNFIELKKTQRRHLSHLFLSFKTFDKALGVFCSLFVLQILHSVPALSSWLLVVGTLAS